jgi:hypothetical protein
VGLLGGVQVVLLSTYLIVDKVCDYWRLPDGVTPYETRFELEMFKSNALCTYLDSGFMFNIIGAYLGILLQSKYQKGQIAF